MMDWGIGMGIGWLVMALFWVFVISAAVWLALSLGGRAATGGGSSEALRILDERFARGEIDAEEYRSRKAALQEGRR